MDKRYQVFVSSTFTDLQDERSKVIQALMEMDCIPAGMELFPAVDEDQFQFIKKIINDCDYYLLIIGGRYGSLTAEGDSYTEKEYDYAVSRGLKVIALIHGDPDTLPVSKSELAPEKVERLAAFRVKASSGRLVKFWQNATELSGLVALSLSKTIKTYPAVGWVRANAVANVELLSEVNSLRKANDDLKAEIKRLQEASRPATEDLAELDKSFVIGGSWMYYDETLEGAVRRWNGVLTWRMVFGLLAPHLLIPTSDEKVASLLSRAVFDFLSWSGSSPRIDDHVFQTIKIQFMAQRLVTVEPRGTVVGDLELFWELTAAGRKQMLAIRAIRRDG